MAGHRREQNRPKRVDASPERQRQHIQQRLDREQDPYKRMSIAFDYLRKQLRQAGPDVNQVAVEQIVQTLLVVAERFGKAG